MESNAKANPTGYAVASSAVSQALKQLGLPESWLQPTLEIVARESSFRSDAKNPTSTARGLFQFLDSTRQNYGGSSVNWDDPVAQALAGVQYIKDRYSTPEKAIAFHNKNNWY